ncbi:hypothetical protein [Paraburkholderia caribensis]|uniref:hypothetical protein n=1 Tax=Paraburkholderia caribensis TaxID=75105 RepID=UPI00078C671B|nr:hypothetical protein [Paraburkholderia caribensis]AMV42288.1 hypothetical protein ATN79_06295 [Paraburkholderia caribensis]
MNGRKDAAPTAYEEAVVDRLKGVERAIINGLGSGNSEPAFIESIAMALGVGSHGTGSFAQDVTRIADALERIADAVQKAR